MFTHSEGVLNLFIGSHRHKLKYAMSIFQKTKTLRTVIKKCVATVTAHTHTVRQSQYSRACCYSCTVLPLHDHADTLGQFVMDIRGAAKVTSKTKYQPANQS